MPPNDGIRITAGTPTRPRVRSRYFARWLMTWSSAGYENPSNCISAIGRHPAIASPTQIPAIPASAIGVSNTRSRPNSACRPSVTRKTPPSAPTSSPNTSVRGSAASASRSAAFSAATIVSSAIAEELLTLTEQGRRRVGERVVEHLARGRLAERGELGAHVRDPGLRLVVARADERVIDRAGVQKVRSVAVDRVPLAPGRDLGLVPVAGRVVGGRVRADAVRDRLDQRGALARSGTFDRVPRDGVHRQDVVAVDPNPRHAVACRPGRDRRGELLVRRDRDRPPVVLAEEDRGRAEDGGEVRALVEVALGGGPVAEVREGAGGAPVELRPHRPPDSMDDLGRHGHADRREPRRDRVVRTAVPRPAVVLEVLDDVDAPHDRRRELAERGEHEVVGAERERAADLRRLLALERRVDREFALALERPAFAVQPSRTDHQPQELAALVLGQSHLDVPDRGAIGRDEPDDRGVGGRGLGHAGRPPAWTVERGQGSIYTL